MTKKQQQTKSVYLIEWHLLKQVARAYLDIQKTRVGMELRAMKMVEHEWLDNGLAREEIISNTNANANTDEEEGDVDGEGETEGEGIGIGTGTGTRGTRIVKIKSEDKEEQKMIDKRIKEVTKQFTEKSPAYKLMISHRDRMFQQEKDLLKEAVALFDNSKLWDWCLEVKGLGEVAGMTFIGYIDPTKAKSVGDVWSYLGLTPQSKLTRGKQAKFNPKIKGRFVGVIAQNVIRSNDNYYASVYRIKKEYYKQRPDLLELFSKKPAGWNAHINRMSVRVLAKLLISHAFDILKCDRRITKEIVIDHRNNIPLKPEDPLKQNEILERYRNNHIEFLERLKLAWANDETENKEKYYNLLRHGEINHYT